MEGVIRLINGEFFLPLYSYDTWGEDGIGTSTEHEDIIGTL